MRRPAIENVFDMEVNSTVTSSRARHLQHRGRRLAVVEIDLGVGEVGEDEDLVAAREGDDVAIEIEVGDIGGRIGRIAEDHRDRLRDRVMHRPLERVEEFRPRLGRHVADGAARHEEAEGVDRIARVGHQHDVARRGDRLRHVGEAFLRAERRDHLALRIELHAEAAAVIGGLRAAQARRCRARRNSGWCAACRPSRSACRGCAAASAGPDCPCRGR